MRGKADRSSSRPSSSAVASNEYTLQSIGRSEEVGDDEGGVGTSDQLRPLLPVMADVKTPRDTRKRGSVGFAHHAEAVWQTDGRDSSGSYVPRGLWEPFLFRVLLEIP